LPLIFKKRGGILSVRTLEGMFSTCGCLGRVTIVRESGGGAQYVQQLLIGRNKILKRDVLEGSSSVFIVSSFMMA
jgi:hypothetical protein